MFVFWFGFYHLSGVLFGSLFSSCPFFPFFLFFFFSPFFAEPCGLWGLGSQAGGWEWASEVGALGLRCWNAREFPAPGNINWWELFWRSPSQHQDPAPPNRLQAAVLNAPCQATSKTVADTHPSANKLPKVILSSQTHQNTPPDATLPIRGKRSSSTHQNSGTSPFHQGAYTSHWTNLTHWGQTSEARGAMILQPAERRPQNEKREKYVSDEGAR